MRAAKTAFLAVFFLLLLLPLLQMAVPLVRIQPLEEKRRLATFPDIVDKYRHGDGRIAAAINQWFDDRVGFRPLLVRTKHQIDYSLFRYSDKVYIGRQGWLFDRELSEREVQSEREGEPQLAQVEDRFVALARYLAERQIRLVLVSNPMKETLDAQYLPPDAPHVAPDTMFQRTRAFLKSRNDWIYVDGQDSFPGCGDTPFSHHDIHMFSQGPYCLARIVVDRIAAAEHRPSPWDESFTFLPYPNFRGGGLVDFLAIFSHPAETAYVPSKQYDPDHPPPEGYFETDLPPGYRWIYHTREPYREGKLPAAFLFGNSFSDFYTSAGMFRYFTDESSVRDSGTNLTDILKHLPPQTRYFIYQFYEPFLAGIASTPIPDTP
jgi:hypothetical protein